MAVWLRVGKKGPLTTSQFWLKADRMLKEADEKPDRVASIRAVPLRKRLRSHVDDTEENTPPADSGPHLE